MFKKILSLILTAAIGIGSIAMGATANPIPGKWRRVQLLWDRDPNGACISVSRWSSILMFACRSDGDLRSYDPRRAIPLDDRE